MSALATRPSRPTVLELVRDGAKKSLTGSVMQGMLAGAMALNSHLRPLTGIMHWINWIQADEELAIQFVNSIPLGSYIGKGLMVALLSTAEFYIAGVCTRVFNGLFPGFEAAVMYHMEYLWRGLVGRQLRPKSVDLNNVGAVRLSQLDAMNWAPICHPAVEYSAPEATWTPRMVALQEISTRLVPNAFAFLVALGFDTTSWLMGSITSHKLVANLWKGYFGTIGGLAGAGGAAALRTIILASGAFTGVDIPLVPSNLQSVAKQAIYDNCANIGLALGTTLFTQHLLPLFYDFDEDDDALASFAHSAFLERERRLFVYGPKNSKYARPPTYAPVPPRLIDPALERRFLTTVFPERVPPPQAASKPEEAQEADKDSASKFRTELRKARQRLAASAPSSQPASRPSSRPTSRPTSRPISPTSSRSHSSDEESSESETDEEETSSSESESEELPLRRTPVNSPKRTSPRTRYQVPSSSTESEEDSEEEEEEDSESDDGSGSD